MPVEAVRGAGGGYALEPSFLVPDFKLWEPGSPGLHTVTVALGGAGGDAATARFGIRTVVADGPHIAINGRRVKLWEEEPLNRKFAGISGRVIQ